MKDCEVLVVGAGINGLTVARELLKAGADNVVVIEKGHTTGLHASGRNSGVLHAGVYYSPGTFKAEYCVAGNKLIKDYCRHNGLKLLESGKVLVAKNYNELQRLYEIKRRAEANGASVELIDERELADIEPYAATYERALYSPDTAVVDPNEILRAITEELLGTNKVGILFDTAFVDVKSGNKAITSKGDIEFKYFVNTAGAYADKVAHKFGVATMYETVPFKGTYKRLKPDRSHLIRGNVYPVPDLNNPFLGVHFTKSVNGDVYIGPTALPALGRENYAFFDDISFESLSFIIRNLSLILKDEKYRYSALREISKYSPHAFYEAARALAPGIKRNDIENSNKVGIRAQLIDKRTNKLEMDFVVIKERNSIHALNAISPGFTCSMAFARHIVDELLGERKQMSVAV